MFLKVQNAVNQRVHPKYRNQPERISHNGANPSSKANRNVAFKGKHLPGFTEEVIDFSNRVLSREFTKHLGALKERYPHFLVMVKSINEVHSGFKGPDWEPFLEKLKEQGIMKDVDAIKYLKDSLFAHRVQFSATSHRLPGDLSITAGFRPQKFDLKSLSDKGNYELSSYVNHSEPMANTKVTMGKMPQASLHFSNPNTEDFTKVGYTKLGLADGLNYKIFLKMNPDLKALLSDQNFDEAIIEARQGKAKIGDYRAHLKMNGDLSISRKLALSNDPKIGAEGEFNGIHGIFMVDRFDVLRSFALGENAHLAK